MSSRRRAEELIRQGRVTVDGRPAHLGQKVDPTRAAVEVDGLPLPLAPDLAYYLLYKPVGVVSTAADPQGRATVVDLLPREPRVVPVGRLDRDSEGLLILTNDGDLAHTLTHPRFGVAKTYVALVTGTVTRADLAQLVSGVELDDGSAAARDARLLDAAGGRSQCEVVMAEGRKREVRRMFDAIGFPVERLVRVAIGDLRDQHLKSGEWRSLTITEVRSLYASAVRH